MFGVLVFGGLRLGAIPRDAVFTKGGHLGRSKLARISAHNLSRVFVPVLSLSESFGIEPWTIRNRQNQTGAQAA